MPAMRGRPLRREYSATDQPVLRGPNGAQRGRLNRAERRIWGGVPVPYLIT
jgi:hypothetical protein